MQRRQAFDVGVIGRRHPADPATRVSLLDAAAFGSRATIGDHLCLRRGGATIGRDDQSVDNLLAVHRFVGHVAPHAASACTAHMPARSNDAALLAWLDEVLPLREVDPAPRVISRATALLTVGANAISYRCRVGRWQRLAPSGVSRPSLRPRRPIYCAPPHCTVALAAPCPEPPHSVRSACGRYGLRQQNWCSSRPPPAWRAGGESECAVRPDSRPPCGGACLSRR